MLTELIVSAGAVGGYLYYKNPKVVFRKAVNNMLDSNSSFYNKQGQQVRLVKIKDNIITLDIRNILGLEEFLKKQDYIETCLCSKVNIKQAGKYVEVELKKARKIINFEPVPTKAHELFVGLNKEGSPILVNMNDYPHLLISGNTGTGKSVFLSMLLGNMICNHDNIDLYMLQVRKFDLTVFKNCKQVKYIARDLNQAHSILKRLNDICIERDKKIERYVDDGILNIKDYNNRFRNNPLKYIYIVLDEFSFFNKSNNDSVKEKKIKKEIEGYIRQITSSSRSSGIFFIGSLQKPTSTSLSPDIKSLLATRVCFRLEDNATSMVILNNNNATTLRDRMAIIKTCREEVATMPNVDLKDIIKFIEPKKERNKKYTNLVPIQEEEKPVIKNNKGITKKKINLKEL